MDYYRSRAYPSTYSRRASISPTGEHPHSSPLHSTHRPSPMNRSFQQNFSGGQDGALGRILQSPHDAYGRSHLPPNRDDYEPSGSPFGRPIKEEAQRGYGSLSGPRDGYGSAGSGSQQGRYGASGGHHHSESQGGPSVPLSIAPSAKRGSKACVACESKMCCDTPGADAQVRLRPQGKESMRGGSLGVESVLSSVLDERDSLRL